MTAKIIQFPVKDSRRLPLDLKFSGEDADKFGEGNITARMARIKAQLETINNLMGMLKEQRQRDIEETFDE